MYLIKGDLGKELKEGAECIWISDLSLNSRSFFRVWPEALLGVLIVIPWFLFLGLCQTG